MIRHMAQLSSDAVGFLKSRECPDGGFSFSASTPHTLEDTYFSLRAMHFLGTCCHDKKTVSYISGINPAEIRSLRQLYRLGFLRSIFRLGGGRVLYRQAGLLTGDTLDDIFYILLLRELNEDKTEYMSEMQEFVDLARENRSTYVSDLHKKAYILKMLHNDNDKGKLISEVEGSFNCDGGFGFCPGSTSFMENTYHALCAFKELEHSPPHRDGCRDFVLRCRSGDRGFGRAVNAISTPEDTCYALECLLILDRMAQGEPHAKRAMR